jgi:predicted Rossmann fold nucleotide-binding protein DprA/Smf involved in DNA uptake
MMVTNDLQAVLLLTAHLPYMSEADASPLTTGEWNRLLVWLRDRGMRPVDLLIREPFDVLRDLTDPRIPGDRIERLLRRGMAVSLALEKWQRAGIWILARSEPGYPQRLKQLLKSQFSPLVYGCGDATLLESGGIAIVGSREASTEDQEFASSLAKRLAREGKSVVSGAARGIDQAAMVGASEAGGAVVGILADGLLKASLSQQYREGLHQRKVVLLSPFQPEARFTAANAMIRNKYIYCLPEAAVVVHCRTSGGTWSGAVENLENRWVPVWAKRTVDGKAGNGGLIRQGASWLPEGILEDDGQNLSDLLKAKPLAQEGLF